MRGNRLLERADEASPAPGLAPLRVLQVVPTLAPGGAERVVAHLARDADPRRFRVNVVSFYAPQPNGLDALVGEREGRITYLNKSVGFDPRLPGRLARAIAAFDPRVIHTHLHALRYVLPVAFRRRRRMAHTVHSLASHEETGFGRVMHRLAWRLGVQPVAVGQAVAESMADVYGLLDTPVIYNGVPVDVFSARADGGRRRWRGALNIADDVLVIGCVARFSEPKNHHLLVRAFARARAQGLQGLLVLVGSGELEGSIRALVSELRLDSTVLFPGRSDDVALALSGMDVFAMPSNWEGTPMALLEAMAAGLPIVATRVGAIPELVSHDVSACLIQSGDEGALAGALLRVAGDASLRRRLSTAAAAAAQRFDIGEAVRAYEALWTRLASAHGPRSRGGGHGSST